MTNLFVLIDSRHKPQQIDLEFMEWLGENGVPFSIVFTKLDKLSPNAGKKLTADYCAALLDTWEELPPVFRTSSERQARARCLVELYRGTQPSAGRLGRTMTCLLLLDKK